VAALTTTAGRRAIPWGWIFGLGIPALVLARIYYLVNVVEVRDYAFFIGAMVQSLQLGSLYALIALGYTMVYGIIRLINFAHGEVFMVGAFISYFLFSGAPFAWPWALLWSAVLAWGIAFILNLWRGSMTHPVVVAGGLGAFAVLVFLLSSFSVNWVAALLLSMLFTGVLGVVIDRVAYRPLRGAGLILFTRNQTPFRPETDWTTFLQFDVLGGTVYTSRLMFLIPILTAVLVTALTLFVTRTRLGKAMRASAQDAETAQMMGINVNRVIATTFLLGSMLAAAGGFLWGLNFGSLNQPAVMGILPGIKAFAAAVIGGIGSLPGAVIGGLLLGFLENFMTALFPRQGDFPGLTEFKDTFAFALLIVVLLVRPSGIVGEDLSEKV
jgi:branched-chain amino acid transport system permease protein